MSSQTTNLHLVKPAYSESQDIAVVNSNMDLIDAAVKTNIDDIAARCKWVSLGSIAASGSKSANVADSSRFVLIIIGVTSTHTLLICNTNTVGNIGITEVIQGTSVTITKAANTLTIANNSTSTAYAYVLLFNGTVTAA